MRHPVTIAVWLCRLSRMTQMPARPEGSQQQECLTIPALRAGARRPQQQVLARMSEKRKSCRAGPMLASSEGRS